MATIFPPSPSVDDEYQGYKWDGTTWNLIGNQYNPASYSASAPSNPKPGDIWIESDVDVPSISPETILTTTAAASTYQPLVSGVSSTEIGYLDGVTSSIQTQINNKSPIASPTFTGVVNAPTFKSTNSSGAEGGEIELAAPATGSTIDTGVALDVQSNNFRIYEKGGTNRGAKFDITTLAAGAGSTIAVTSGVFVRQTSTTSSGEASTVNINTRPWNMPWGIRYEGETISNTITSGTVAGLTTSFTFLNGRRYKVSATIVGLYSSGRVLGSISAGTLGSNRFFDVATGGYFNPSGYLVVTGTGTSQSVTVGFSIVSGSSTLAADNLVGNYHSLIIEDIGII